MSTESSHYYTHDGKACHTQPTKKGAKNPERPTTVKDAIRLKLLPSVSVITRIMSNDGLDYYKRKMVAEAAWDSPVSSHEEKEEYCSYLLDKAQAPMRASSTFGSALHAPLDAYYGQNKAISDTEQVQTPDGRQILLKDVLSPAIDRIDALGLQIQSTEKVLVHPLGYAGTTDMLATKDGRRIVIDHKTKTTKEGEPIIAPFTYQMQLAAYWKAAYPDSDGPMGGDMSAANNFISSTEIGRGEIKWYTHEELSRAWDAFKCCLELWKIVNNYRSEY